MANVAMLKKFRGRLSGLYRWRGKRPNLLVVSILVAMIVSAQGLLVWGGIRPALDNLSSVNVPGEFASPPHVVPGSPVRAELIVAQGPVSAQWSDAIATPPDGAGPAPEPPVAVPRQPVAQPTLPGSIQVPGEGVQPTPSPTSLPYIENVPVSTLWPKYFSAVELIQQGEIRGVKELYLAISDEDVKWFEANYKYLADMLSSGTVQASPEQLKLLVLQAFLRNMPKSSQREPKVSQALASPYAIARISDQSTTPPTDYETLLVQEGGRWVIAHFFFARDFVWMPQLAHYKLAKRIPNSPEELVYLRQGLQPFVEWARGQFTTCGYEREGTRGSSATPTTGSRR